MRRMFSLRRALLILSIHDSLRAHRAQLNEAVKKLVVDPRDFASLSSSAAAITHREGCCGMVLKFQE
jgi:hypothetical protein